MSKYKENALKTNKTPDLENLIDSVEPILKAEVEAMLSSAKADKIRAKSALDKAEENVKIARGIVTDNGEVWLRNLNKAKTERDVAAEDFKTAELNYDDLEEELKMFN